MILRFWRLNAALIILTGLFAGCEIINPEEEIPSYIRINEIKLDPEGTGYVSSDIKDAWVYAKDPEANTFNLIGVFELPATVPILISGNTEIDIQPGVITDGIRGLRTAYPFYTTFRTQTELIPGTVTTLNPVVNYRTGVIPQPLPVQENFSSQPLSLTIPSNLGYQLEIEQDPAFQFPASEGAVGIVRAKENVFTPIVITSVFNGSLPQQGSRVYLEMDYKSTLQFTVGVLVTANGKEFESTDLVIRPNTDFTKLYVNLIDEVSQANSPFATFKVFIKATPLGSSQDYIAFDNIRLIHFKN